MPNNIRKYENEFNKKKETNKKQNKKFIVSGIFFTQTAKFPDSFQSERKALHVVWIGVIKTADCPDLSLSFWKVAEGWVESARQFSFLKKMKYFVDEIINF